MNRSHTRIIFLDIDGVICCNKNAQLEPPKLAQLQRVVEATGAKIVLSSDWRREPLLLEQAMEGLRGIGTECIGTTPEHSIRARVRPKEILEWLQAYEAEEGSVTSWCAVDDRNLVLEEGGMPGLVGHLVRTDYYSGLTASIANQMITTLTDQRRSDELPTTSAALASAPPSPVTPGTTARLPSTEVTPATGQSDRLSSMDELLEEISSTHLKKQLHGETLHGLNVKLHRQGRVSLLNHLRNLGIARLGDRQTLVNTLSRAQKQGRVESA